MNAPKITVNRRQFDSFVNLPTDKEGNPRLEGAITVSRRPAGAKGAPATVLASTGDRQWDAMTWSLIAAASQASTDAAASSFILANSSVIQADPELSALLEGVKSWRNDGSLESLLALKAGGEALFSKVEGSPSPMPAGMYVPGKTRQPAPRGSYASRQDRTEITAADLGL